MENQEIYKWIEKCAELKPTDLIIDDLPWKYLCRSVYRGKNVLILGPTRSGKTKAAQSVAKALNRQDRFFYFNFGSTQDARATLIGNTVFKKETGTIFHPSQFVKAIQTPNAVVLLDEISRGHHDAWNILMSVIDPTQRYLRLDESEDSDIIVVAKGVTFIATANVGNEYTATKVMDRALISRFPVIIEMRTLSDDEELQLLTILYPEATTDQIEKFKILTKISYDIKKQCKIDESRINSFVPTGTVVEMAELVLDGFSLDEIIKMVVYPMYSEDSGTESERLYVKQIVQKYLDTTASSTLTPINDPSVIDDKKTIIFS
jgi:MoxR-like ATPase